MKIKDGLSYSFKIPTDEELSNYVGSVWDRGQADYDYSNPVSINYLLSNHVPIMNEPRAECGQSLQP